MPKIEIKNDGVLTQVKIDGNEIKGIRRIEFINDINNPAVPIVRLDLLADKATIDSNCVLELPDVYKPFYVKK